MPTNTTSPLSVIASESPAFTTDDAREIAADYYGLRADATALVSERDQNFRLRTPDGAQYVLKIANAVEDPQVTDFQVQALLHIAARAPEQVPVPEILPALDGRSVITVNAGTASHATRVVSYLDGRPLDTSRLSAPLCRNMGAALARLGLALQGFSHPGESQSLLWDMRQAPVLKDLLVHIADADLRARVGACIDDFEQRVLPRYPSLRTQVVHNDMNPANVLVDAEHPERVAGIIDFGDMLRAPLVVDVAIAASYMRAWQGNPLTWVAEFVAGYHGGNPLELPEIDLIYDLINTRLAATVAILHWRLAARGGDDAYLDAAALSESTAAPFLTGLRELPRKHARELLRQVCASVTEL